MFSIIKNLYINMQFLPNFYKKCYLGLKNFMFSKYFKQHSTFYFHNFTIAFQERKLVK
jgi:hypothetical protein